MNDQLTVGLALLLELLKLKTAMRSGAELSHRRGFQKESSSCFDPLPRLSAQRSILLLGKRDRYTRL